MIKKLLFICLLGLALIGNLQALEPAPEIRDVEIKIVLLDVDEVNNVKQNFTANLATAMRWQDHSLVHDGPGSISRPLADVWHPSIQILNQQRIVATFPQTVEIYPDGTVVYRQRYWGNFSQPLELKSFPFDTQKLTLTLANVGFGMQSVRLLTSPDSGISDQS
jgi:gamma-aminobutyric acid receptor subunit beta